MERAQNGGIKAFFTFSANCTYNSVSMHAPSVRDIVMNTVALLSGTPASPRLGVRSLREQRMARWRGLWTTRSTWLVHRAWKCEGRHHQVQWTTLSPSPGHAVIVPASRPTSKLGLRYWPSIFRAAHPEDTERYLCTGRKAVNNFWADHLRERITVLKKVPPFKAVLMKTR